MPTSFTHTTFAQAKALLAQRLTDSSNIYCTDAELGRYIVEALSTWGLLTSYWIDAGFLSTVANQPYYDLTLLSNVSGTALLSQTLYDFDLVTDVQYALLEPATGNSWTGSEQFTLTDVLQAIDKRRNRLLVDSEAYITRTTNLATGIGIAIIDLPETHTVLKRLAFSDADGNSANVYPEDINSQKNYSSTLLIDSGTPISYSSIEQQNRLFVAPINAVSGSFEDLAIVIPNTIGPSATGTILGLPDDLVRTALKWGVLAELLGKDGPGRDMPRAYFCERRYNLYVASWKLMPTVLTPYLNGLPTNVISFADADNYNSGWQNTKGSPQLFINMENLAALSPVPDGVYEVVVDVARKSVVPIVNSDYIQVRKEYMEPILDYAQHLASFKMGGMEFSSTYRHAKNFFAAAESYNNKLKALNPAATLVKLTSNLDSLETPSTAQGDYPFSKGADLGAQ